MAIRERALVSAPTIIRDTFSLTTFDECLAFCRTYQRPWADGLRMPGPSGNVDWERFLAARDGRVWVDQLGTSFPWHNPGLAWLMVGNPAFYSGSAGFAAWHPVVYPVLGFFVLKEAHVFCS